MEKENLNPNRARYDWSNFLLVPFKSLVKTAGDMKDVSLISERSTEKMGKERSLSRTISRDRHDVNNKGGRFKKSRSRSSQRSEKQSVGEKRHPSRSKSNTKRKAQHRSSRSSKRRKSRSSSKSATKIRTSRTKSR